MSTTMTATAASTHRLLSELPTPRMAKADLKKLEIGFRVDIGRCVERARKALGWSQKELADAIERATGEARDLAQVSRWEGGKERPQFDALFSVEALRGPLVIQLAGLSEHIEVETTITIRRSA